MSDSYKRAIGPGELLEGGNVQNELRTMLAIEFAMNNTPCNIGTG